jgi:hypothetical protein
MAEAWRISVGNARLALVAAKIMLNLLRRVAFYRRFT